MTYGADGLLESVIVTKRVLEKLIEPLLQI